MSSPEQQAPRQRLAVTRPSHTHQSIDREELAAEAREYERRPARQQLQQHRPSRSQHAPPPLQRHTKDQFLHATYHSTLDPAHGPYESLLGDSDATAAWDDIVEVRLLSHAGFECPICLSAPVAARLARCGHLFCFACIVRAASYAGGASGTGALTFAPCPLCGQPVLLNELRSACLTGCAPPLTEGDMAHMTLLARARDSCVPAPPTTTTTMAQQLPDENAPWAVFSRYSIATRSCATVATLSRERSELESALKMAISEGDDNAPFISAALDRLAQQESNAEALAARTSAKDSSSSSASSAAAVAMTTMNAAGPTTMFYQEAGGQMMFLCALNMKMLVQDSVLTGKPLPRSFCAPLLEAVEVIQSSETRRRFRPTAYLPLATVFRLVELDLTGAVSAQTMARYASEIANRAQRRAQEREQLERERRIIQETPLAGFSPVFDESDFEPLPSSSPTPPPPPNPVRTPPPGMGEPTFAEIARLSLQRTSPSGMTAIALTREEEFPSLGSSSSGTAAVSAVSPSRPALVVAPSATVLQQPPASVAATDIDEEAEEEEDQHVAPSFAQSFAQALSAPRSPQPQPQAKGKSKKRHQQMLLLSNSTPTRRF